MAPLAFRNGPPRRKPFPFDAEFAGTGVLLGAAKPGQAKVVQSSRPPDLASIQPASYEYSGLNPVFGTVTSWDDLSLGYGQRTQPVGEAKTRRYYYALNADLSVPSLWLKGPNITTVTPSTKDATNGVTHFFEVGGKLFALNGRYCHLRTSDVDWDTSRQDFGVGKAAVDVGVFYSNVAGGASLAYVAMGETEPIYKFDGTTFTQHAESSKLYALALCAVGGELYRASGTNTVAKVDTDTDPFVIANWTAGNAFYVGDKSAAVNRLAVTATGALLVLKADGVYSLDESGEDIRYFPFMQFGAAATNFKGYGAWLNDLYLPVRQGLYRLSPDMVLTQVGPETLPENDSPVYGRITAFAGHDSLHAYAAVYNGTDSYLLKLIRSADGHFAWHGAISAAFASKSVTALYKSTIGAAANHARLYIGFSDGTLGYFTLPNSANPAADSSYTFSTAAGYLYLSTWGQHLFQNDPKTLLAFSIDPVRATATDYAQIAYRSYLGGSWVAHSHDFMRVPWDKDTIAGDVSGTLFDLRVTLVSGATSNTPKIAGMGLHWRLSPELRQLFTLHILAANGLTKRNGTPYRQGADAIRTLVERYSNGTAPITIILPDETSRTVVLAGFAHTQAWDDRSRQWYGAYRIDAAETASSVTVYGTIARLAPYTLADMGSYTIAELDNL